MTTKNLEENVQERFIKGIHNDLLRGHLLATYKQENSFTRLFSNKSVLERAKELNETYGQKQVDINLIQQKKKVSFQDLICYKCGEKGHIKTNCQNSVNQNGTRTATSINNQYSDESMPNQNTPANNHYRLNRIDTTDQLTGYCKIHGNTTRFLADSGANKTVIDASLINEDERTTIRKCTYNVILADGSKTNILGVKICKIQLGQHVVNLEV